MQTCPHCGTKGISALAKLWSGSASPAQCSSCGGSSYLRSTPLWGLMLHEALLAAAFIAAFLLWHWWPLVVYFLLLLGWAAWLGTRARLTAISLERAQQKRRNGYLFLRAFVVLVTLAGIIQAF